MLGMFCLCQRPVTAHGCSRCPLWQPCAATGRCHYSIVRTMTPWNHALRVSFVCSKAWVVLPLLLFCRYCCNSVMQECRTLGCNRRPPGCTHTAPISRLFRLGQSINRKCWFSWRDGGQGCTAPSLPLATSQAAAGDVVYPNCWS